MADDTKGSRRPEAEIYWEEPAVYSNWLFASVNGGLTRIVFCDRQGEQITARSAVLLETSNAKNLIGLLERLIKVEEAKAATAAPAPGGGATGG